MSTPYGSTPYGQQLQLKQHQFRCKHFLRTLGISTGRYVETIDEPNLLGNKQFAEKEDLVKLFTKKLFNSNSSSIIDLIDRDPKNLKIGEEYLKIFLNENNLFLNIFILFFAFSDKIVTYTQKKIYEYRPKEDENKCIQDFLNSFSQIKEIIFIAFKAIIKTIDRNNEQFIANFKQKINEQITHLEALELINIFFEMYEIFYNNKKKTNFNQDLSNDFVLHYHHNICFGTTYIFNKFNKCCDDKYKKYVYDTLKTSHAQHAQHAQNAQNAQNVSYPERKLQQIQERDERAAKRERKRQREEEEDEVQREREKKKGGSTKLIIYIFKIEKLRELNKKLRKNKTKNKSKIEINNKLINELKIKIKKEKQKEKQKKKLQKEKQKKKLIKKKQNEKNKMKKEKEKKNKMKKQKKVLKK